MRGRAAALLRLQCAAATATTATASAAPSAAASAAAASAAASAARAAVQAAAAAAPSVALPQLLRVGGGVGSGDLCAAATQSPPPIPAAGGGSGGANDNSSSGSTDSGRPRAGPAGAAAPAAPAAAASTGASAAASAKAAAAATAASRGGGGGARLPTCFFGAPAAAAAFAASPQQPPPASRLCCGARAHYSSAAVAAPEAAASAAAAAAAAASSAAAAGRHDDDEDAANDSPLVAAARRDPFALVAGEVEAVGDRMRRTVAVAGVPALADAALYFLRPGVTGKRLRPTLLLLMAGALEGEGGDGGGGGGGKDKENDDPLSVDMRAPHEPCCPHETRRRQQRVAEVAELIHVASLLHDDVLDEASTRRGVPALHAAAAVAAAASPSSSSSSSSASSSRRADKLAILAGDFLLARASVTLAALGDARVVALLSRVLEHLVSGEVMQMSARGEQLASPEHYLRKTYAKTASLMANSCRAVALIGGCEGGGDLAFEAARGGDGLVGVGGEDGGEGGGAADVWGERGGGGGNAGGGGIGPLLAGPLAPADAAWEYGRHLGMAFQVVDDLLDLTGAPGVLGKPTLSDLRAGLATAPVLMAAEEAHEGAVGRELRALTTARFSGGERDVLRAVELVARTRGVERAWALARRHADAAAAAVRALPPARTERARAHRAALVALTRRVLERRK